MTQRPARSSNQFCGNCGATLLADARFCVECGEAPGGMRAAPRRRLTPAQYAPWFVLAVVLIGGGSAVWLGTFMAKEPPRVPGRRAAGQQGQLPAGHPPVTVSDDVRAAIGRKAEEMAAKPTDIDGWKQLGLMQYQAGQLEPQYLADAAKTYQHVLDQQPKDAEALRALGDIAYIREDRQQAQQYYQRLLEIRPNDPQVHYLLGNIHLLAHRSAEAIQSYQAALAADPTLLDAQVNLGVAYRASGDTTKALEELRKARGLAGDDATREQVDEMIARVSQPQPAPRAAAAAGDLKGDVESVFRSHPIVGSKLERLDWTDERTVRVVVRDFPMDTIPEFAREKFTDHIKTGVRESKTRHAVTDPVKVEFVDAASGSVMETITE